MTRIEWWLVCPNPPIEIVLEHDGLGGGQVFVQYLARARPPLCFDRLIAVITYERRSDLVEGAWHSPWLAADHAARVMHALGVSDEQRRAAVTRWIGDVRAARALAPRDPHRDTQLRLVARALMVETTYSDGSPLPWSEMIWQAEQRLLPRVAASGGCGRSDRS